MVHISLIAAQELSLCFLLHSTLLGCEHEIHSLSQIMWGVWFHLTHAQLHWLKLHLLVFGH